MTNMVLRQGWEVMASRYAPTGVESFTVTRLLRSHRCRKLGSLRFGTMHFAKVICVALDARCCEDVRVPAKFPGACDSCARSLGRPIN
jgi:hypothetical protein